MELPQYFREDNKFGNGQFEEYEEILLSMKIDELRELCKKEQISALGTKAALRNRLSKLYLNLEEL